MMYIMFDSVVIILNNYLDGISRYSLFSVIALRSENPEDIVYIVDTDKGVFIVLESDYIVDLHDMVVTLKGIARRQKFRVFEVLNPKDIPNEEIVLRLPKGKWRYIVARIAPESQRKSHFNPNSYGNT